MPVDDWIELWQLSSPVLCHCAQLCWPSYIFAELEWVWSKFSCVSCQKTNPPQKINLPLQCVEKLNLRQLTSSLFCIVCRMPNDGSTHRRACVQTCLECGLLCNSPAFGGLFPTLTQPRSAGISKKSICACTSSAAAILVRKVSWPQLEFFPEKMSCSGKLCNLISPISGWIGVLYGFLKKRRPGMSLFTLFTFNLVVFFLDMISSLSPATIPCVVRW